MTKKDKSQEKVKDEISNDQDINKEDNIDYDSESTAEESDLQPSSVTEEDLNNLKIKYEDVILRLRAEIENNIKYEDVILRLRAEIENNSRRYEKELDNIKVFAVSKFAKELLSVMDNLNRALKFLPKTPDTNLKNILTGIEMTKKNLLDIFKKNKILPIEPKKGDIFNHEKHEAILEVDLEKPYKPGTIGGLVESGYSIGNGLLRAALVKVYKS